MLSIMHVWWNVIDIIIWQTIMNCLCLQAFANYWPNFPKKGTFWLIEAIN